MRSDGPLQSFSAASADLSGTLSVAGGVDAVRLHGVSGVLAASEAINSLSVAADVSGARVLAGADLGSDGRRGGTRPAADTFGAGSIGSCRIGGKVTSSVLTAGLAPADPRGGAFVGPGDRVVGGKTSSIGVLTLRGGADAASRFIAGAFGKVRAPGKVDLGSDPRFEVL